MKKDHVISPNGKAYLYDDDIIIWEECPNPTGSSIEILLKGFKHILDLPDQSFYIVFDLRKVKKPPDAEGRFILKNNFNQYRDKLLHGCVIVPNQFMKITAKLVMKSYFNSISYHTKMDEALNKIESIRES